MGCCKKDGDKGQCGVVGRVFFYIFGFIGIAFSLLTVFSCKFLSYSPTNSGVVPSTLPSPFILSDFAYVGLFRWDNRDELDVEDVGCVYYSNDQINDGFDSAFRTAQICGYVAVICAGLALLLSTIEFVCCRFCCSKFFLSFFMMCGMVTQALTFALFTTDNMCTAGRTCSMQIGAYFSIAAACCYFIASIIVCTTPKPTPWIKRVKAEDDDMGCLVCCTKKKQPEEETEPKTMPVQDSPDEVVAAVAAGAAAAAAAGTAVALANDEEKEKDQLNDDKDPEAAVAAAGEAEETPAEGEGDEEMGRTVEDDDSEADAPSEVPSVTPSEPSQVGEEITLEASFSKNEDDDL